MNGYLTGSADDEYEPHGTYYYTGSSGYHRGWLRGTGGTDFDLYLYKWNGSSWALVARSESGSSNELIAYNGSSGYYLWRVYSYNRNWQLRLLAAAALELSAAVGRPGRVRPGRPSAVGRVPAPRPPPSCLPLPHPVPPTLLDPVRNGA